jgi:hypothetical protein
MDWAIRFPDNFYAYVYERWWPASAFVPGHSRAARREHFSFHYGPTNPKLTANGIPERDKSKYPAIIRIDCDKNGPHLHFHGEGHIPQARVPGLKILDSDPFIFMQAVIEYRNSGNDFDTILHFKVTQ